MRSYTLPRRIVDFAVASVTLALAVTTAHAQSLVNGGFETPDIVNILVVNAGDSSIAPWTVGVGSVDVVDQNNAFLTGPAFEGTQYLDLDGSPGPGQITQTFATTTGTTYLFTFAYANNYGASSASATARIFDGGGNRLLQTVTHSTSASGNLNWTLFSGAFTAGATTTSVQFSSLSSGGSSSGLLLDGVAVAAVVPEPGTAFLIAPLLPVLLGAIALRRRQQSAHR